MSTSLTVAPCPWAIRFGLSLLLGADPVHGFLFALGVTVALVPDGLLPTVTLSLAWGARQMAGWALAALAIPLVLGADAAYKIVLRRQLRDHPATGPTGRP